MLAVWLCLLLAPAALAAGMGDQSEFPRRGQRSSFLHLAKESLKHRQRRSILPNGANRPPLTFLDKLRFPRRRRSFSSECQNSTISLTSHELIEDNYDENYLDNTNCIWTITTPKAGDRILLVSLDFLLEDSYNCRYDYVEIFDGDFQSSNSIGKLCGRKNVRLISRTQKMTIHFKTDSSVTAPGFQFEVAPVSGSSVAPCNKTYRYPGTILSPNYGPNRHYPDNVTCLYSIKAPTNKKVKLQFHDFVLEEGPCIDDYLTVYDGKSSESEEIGTYCGRGNPKSITSSSSDMLLYFHTNSFIRNRGFKLTYDFVSNSSDSVDVVAGDLPPEYDPDCSAVVTTVAQNVSSPHFGGDEYYLQRRKCRTTLKPPEGHGVRLLFRKFDMEESLDCIYDHVNVTYNPKQDETRMIRFCGYQRRNTLCFYSPSGNVTLDFKSDILFEGSGYEAEYSFIGPNDTALACKTPTCNESCQGYCYNNGGGYHCACPLGKVPPDCVQNITWLKPLRENLTMYEGTLIELSCALNHPHTITVWDSNFFMLPNETKSHISVDGANLKINEARVSDSGLYTCTVQAGETLLSQTINITIIHEEEYCGSASHLIQDPNSNAAYATIQGDNSTKAPEVIPWQVHLWDKSKESHHCGGVLISERYVLTAAHCVKGSKAADFNHNNIRVSVGTLSCTKADGESRSVARYMTHPKYNKNTLEYDFALLELNRPIYNKSNQIYPICLPQSPVLWNDITVGYKAIIAGCGKNNDDTPETLHMVNVPIVNRTICENRPRTENEPFTDDMFCAGHKKKNIGDACDGDSGGGIVAKVKGRWTLLGLISFGKGCAKKGHYGYYANASKALEWIQEVAPNCGRTFFISGNHESGKILHGQNALPKQFPYAGALLDTGNKLACSVTIISTKWALTARHCVEGKKKRRKNKRLLVGELTLPNDRAETGQTVAEIITDVTGPDVALLRLKPGVKGFTDHVQPICLPAEDEGMADDETGWIAGWGQHDLAEPRTSDVLLYAEMTKTNATYCKAEAPRLPGQKQTDICFVGTFNQSIKAFSGDSGTGIAWRTHGRYTLSGVYRGGHKKNPVSVYTELQVDVVKWLKKKMGWTEDEK